MPVIQLTKAGVFASTVEVERLRADFQAGNPVRIPRLFDPSLLSHVMSVVDEGEWTSYDGEFYREYVLEGVAREFLHFIANRPDVLDLVRRITALDSLTRFKGRIYRMVPNAGHIDAWHSDAAEGRRVGMSINLSPRGYQGGVFQMRNDATGKIIAEIANTGLADAILFPLGLDLSHRVTEISGEEAKTAFAGWYYENETSFWDWMRAGKSGGG